MFSKLIKKTWKCYKLIESCSKIIFLTISNFSNITVIILKSLLNNLKIAKTSELIKSC